VNGPEDNKGIMLQCNHSGKILRVIRDDLGITKGCLAAATIFDIVDPESREKAQEFCRAAQKGLATFGWELNVPCNGQVVGLLLFGGITDDTIVICGSPSREGVNKMFDAMMKIQNEQLNALRTALKEEQLAAAEYSRGQQDILDDFTRVNNELVNLQRELAGRNAELAEANKQLESLATTDGLTGLKNHRAFQELLESEWARAERDGMPLSLLMMDVDQFKQFNDQYGHPAGDQVLKQVAQIVASECRVNSVAARYGGEEFAVILPNCDRDGVQNVAERIRRTLEIGPWELRSITASLGTATKHNGIPNQAALIAEADAAMYRAKEGGRNRVCSDCGVSDAAYAL